MFELCSLISRVTQIADPKFFRSLKSALADLMPNLTPEPERAMRAIMTAVNINRSNVSWQLVMDMTKDCASRLDE